MSALPPATARPPLAFSWRHGLDSFPTLRPAWRRLAELGHPSSVFHTETYAAAWLAAFAPSRFATLVVQAGTEVVALLPWVASPARLCGIPVRRWIGCGGLPTGTTPASRTSRWLARDLRWGWGATTALLLHPDAPRETLAAGLQESLRALPADLLHLQGLGAEVEFLGAEGRVLVTSREPNWVAPSGGAATGRNRLSKRTRKRLASGLAALRGLPGFAWSVVPGSTLEAAELEELALLERRSSKAAHGASILTSGPRNHDFLSALLAHEPSCRVGRLRAEGGLIAWALGMRAGTRGEGFLLAHDPAYDDHYPGLLAYVMVEEALDAERPLASHALGRGAEFWKTGRLLAEAEVRSDLAVFASTLRGRILRFLHSRIRSRRPLRETSPSSPPEP